MPFSEGKGWVFFHWAMQHQVCQDMKDPFLVHTTMSNCWQEFQVHMCSRYKPFIVYWWKEILVNCKVKFQLYPTNSISGGKSNTTNRALQSCIFRKWHYGTSIPLNITTWHDLAVQPPGYSPVTWAGPGLHLQLFQLCTPSWQLPMHSNSYDHSCTEYLL